MWLQVAINSLMRILRDPSLASYHLKVVGSLMFIFKVGVAQKCVFFLFILYLIYFLELLLISLMSDIIFLLYYLFCEISQWVLVVFHTYRRLGF